MKKICPAILSGGSGTRLWPLSREGYPKQFMDLGDGNTLFRQTLQRAERLAGHGEPVIVCNERHRYFVSAELLAAGADGTILLEPEPRNTAPAIAVAALELMERTGGEDPLLLVMPSDHLLPDADAFAACVAAAVPLAEQGRLVTFGVTPTRPETGFGYIQRGSPLGDGFQVARFVEKPDAGRARAMLEAGDHLWNSGIFLFQASTLLRELERLAPEILQHCRAAWRERTSRGKFVHLATAGFLASPSLSIDHAVMEKTELAAVVPLSTPWNDLGSWEAFYQAGPQDARHNVCHGDSLAQDSDGCYLHSSHRLVAALGLRDIAVIETQDAVLVAQRDRVQEVKSIVELLNRQQRPETRLHPLVHRPWGSYETLALDDRFQVKRIVVKPGAELSLQMHHHRAEHWIVVSGTAEVTNDGSVRLFSENQSTYIPLGTVHRLKNPGVIPLVLIEIQSGAYLGEDDIVRLDDVYGRTPPREQADAER